MSTKIYNGYKIAGIETLSEASRMLHLFRDKIEKKCEELTAIKVAELATDVVDRRALKLKIYDIKLGKCEAKTGPMSWAYSILTDRRKQVDSGYREPEFDFSCEISLIPYRKSVLALVYAEQEEYFKIWNSLPLVADYAYYNNTDRPRGIKASEWKERGEAWDEALGHRPPCEVGLSFSCMGKYSYPHPDVEEVLHHVPSLETRASQHALSMVRDREFERRRKEAGKGWKDKLTREDVGMLSDVQLFLTEDKAGKSLVQEESERVKAKLKSVLTNEDLLGWKPDPVIQNERPAPEVARKKN